MNQITIPLLSTIFTTASAFVGIPSAAFLTFYLVHRVTKFTTGSESTTNFGSNPDAVLLMLKWMTSAIGAIGGLVSAAAELVFNVLAVASAVGLVLAIMCWFTGQGLSANAGWARASAGTVLVPLLLVSLVLALSFNGLGRLPMLAIAIFCFLALRTLWTGYVAPAV